MKPVDVFRLFLASHPNRCELERVCKSYKTSESDYAFELNGRLKGGLPLEKFNADLPFLQQLICMTLDRTITLYRMTSVCEFTVPATQALNGGPFQYQAFMSTSGTLDQALSFYPGTHRGSALLLEIECPPCTTFAPIDLVPGADEDEYLLGCGTTFEVVKKEEEITGSNLDPWVSVPTNTAHLKLRAIHNPPYVKQNIPCHLPGT